MSNDDREVDVSRRENLNSLLGVLGGALGVAALANCSAPEEQTGKVAQPWTTGDGGVSGTNFKWVDTIKGVGTIHTGTNLYNTSAGSDLLTSGTPAVVVGGYWTPNDGGGGIFYWSNSNITDDGGTHIVPTASGGDGGVGAVGPGWVRIYSGPLNVKWFGAKGDGTTPDDAAINAAINAATLLAKSVTFGGDLNPPSTAPAICFPAGIYYLNGSSTQGTTAALTVPSTTPSLSFFSDSGAILYYPIPSMSNPNILTFLQGNDSFIRGLAFVGGANQILIQEAAQHAAPFLIDKCEFHMSSDYAIKQHYTGPGTMSMHLTIDHCYFDYCAGVLSAVGDINVVQNTYVDTPSTQVNAAIYAMFVTNPGNLYLRNVTGADSLNNSSYPGVRWIDNYGSVFIEDSRFGGDAAPGMPIVYHYTQLPANSLGGRWIEGSTISIRNSTLATGSTSQPDTSVIVISAGCPQRILIEDVVGPWNTPTLNAGWSGGAIIVANPNLGSAITGSGSSGYGWAANFIRIRIDPNLLYSTASIPAVLIPYLDLATSNPFQLQSSGGSGSPIAQRLGATPVGTQVSQSSMMFQIPSNMAGFVAMLTVTVSPNNGGSNSYRSLATYMLSMTTGFNGTAVTNYLTLAPLHVPNTQGITQVSIVGMYFDSQSQTTCVGGQTCTASRPAASGGTFTIVWDSNFTGVQAYYPYASIQPLQLVI